MEFESKSHMGRYYKRKGSEHELEVRKALEEQGWIVTKWQNNIDISNHLLIQAKSNRFHSRSTGFPDFLAFRRIVDSKDEYEVMFVECKLRGYKGLKKEEKEKIKILQEEYGFKVLVL